MRDAARSTFTGANDKRRLRVVLAAFFAALLIPSGVLVHHAFGQLTSEAFYRHRLLAEELSNRIDAQARGLIAVEEARSSADYRFLVVQGEARANFLQRSALSEYPVKASIPGLLAYFQVDASGAFSTPLLPVGTDPAAYGVAADETELRRALEGRVRGLLIERPDDRAREAITKKVSSSVERQDEAAEGQAVFDRLSEAEPSAPAAVPSKTINALGRVEDLKLDSQLAMRARDFDKPVRPSAERPPAAEAPRVARKEQIAVPDVGGVAANVAAGDRVTTFASELDPFVFRRLDVDHFVLFRSVWLDGQRMVQGAVIAQGPLLEGLVDVPFLDTVLSQMSSLTVAYRGDVLRSIGASHASRYDASRMDGELLYRAPLSAPLNDIELIFSVAQLPIGPGGKIVGWATLVLAVVLCVGSVVVYRFAAAQIDLTRQQQDFVSAVSHELKTPLTSIRMYGEILKAGWASEEKKKTYYEFIFHESERLSRLIANVLRLARLTRNGDQLDVKSIAASELLNLVESKVTSQVEQAGFRLDVIRDPDASIAIVAVDEDSFVQILINLVDNALKFAGRSPHRVVEVGSRATRDRVQFWVRDYGPGIAQPHRKRIFELFYRAENELTRETSGTGIGLALVKELTGAMGGNVDVRNCEPGAQFTVAFPRVAAR